MHRFGLIALTTTLLLAAPWAQAGPGRTQAVDAKITFLEPIVFHNMTVVPISTHAKGPFERFTLLEAGLKQRTLKIRELGGQSDQAQVSAVQVKNTGKLRAFVLSGEMILGGKQDRILSSDTVIPNDGEWHKVEVFCVEQGRWRGRKMKFKGSGALAHAKLRKAALSGSQGEVWAEVQRKNASHGTNNSTHTYRRTVQDAKIRSKISKYRQQVTRQLPDAPLVGFVFAINGQTKAADLFANPLLHSDLQDKLLSAYILEALEHQQDKRAPKYSKKKAQGFYKKARGAKRVSTKKSGSTRNHKKKAKGIVGTQAVDEASGKVLKESYFAD